MYVSTEKKERACRAFYDLVFLEKVVKSGKMGISPGFPANAGMVY
jgi:hypothetical protein